MEDGRKVSFWDLYRYVYHNPELKALVESRRADIPLVDSEKGGGGGGGGGSKVAELTSCLLTVRGALTPSPSRSFSPPYRWSGWLGQHRHWPSRSPGPL